jgi:hypothetical protein
MAFLINTPKSLCSESRVNLVNNGQPPYPSPDHVENTALLYLTSITVRNQETDIQSILANIM